MGARSAYGPARKEDAGGVARRREQPGTAESGPAQSVGERGAIEEIEVPRRLERKPVSLKSAVQKASAVGCGNREPSPWAQYAPCFREPSDGIMHVLEVMAHRDGVEAGIGEPLLQQPAVMDSEALFTRARDHTRIEVDAFRLPSK